MYRGPIFRANTELLPEELVNFTIGIIGLSTKHRPGDIQNPEYKCSWEGEFTGESLKVQMGRLSTVKWWLLVWKTPDPLLKRRGDATSLHFSIASHGLCLLSQLSSVLSPAVIWDICNALFDSHRATVLHPHRSSRLGQNKWFWITGSWWEQETNMHVSRKTGWDKRFVQC